MTLDRDQIKRDAEAALQVDAALPRSPMAPFRASQLARHCLALLTELEQADRKTVDALSSRAACVAQRRVIREQLEAAEARLAKVPPLVEAAKNVAGLHSGAWPELAEALAAWEAD